MLIWVPVPGPLCPLPHIFDNYYFLSYESLCGDNAQYNAFHSTKAVVSQVGALRMGLQAGED